jgi:cytochrome P450
MDDLSNEKTGKKSTVEEDETLIVGNALIILIAGYDTTSSTISFCA